MVSVLPRARLRPTGLGWYFSSAAAARTLAAMSGSTVKFPFMTRETVACETPAFTATSAMPIRPLADFLAMGNPSFAPPGRMLPAAAGAGPTSPGWQVLWKTAYTAAGKRFLSFFRQFSAGRGASAAHLAGKRFLSAPEVVDG